ncbi:MAG: RnfABCDGE type electron transport complex subunit D [Bacteroidales bacterium]|nr:RnfABCDGE type electron transport complex subunit D [Bacteroidales bacterium]
MNNQLTISSSPHVHGNWTIEKAMYGVVLAMIPAMLVSFYMFGLGALRVMLISVIACLAIEYIIQKYLIKGPVTITDGSAIVTGILLAFNVPTSIPTWMLIAGAIVAIGMGKMSFGGLGKNPFNPALVGRVFMLISFPAAMTTWPKPIMSRQYFSFSGLDEKVMDSITGPTPLGILQEQGPGAVTPDYVNHLLGSMSGSMGEISAIALILGGVYMLVRKIITWHIPVSYLLSSFLFAGILWLVDPTQYADPLFHMVTGGLMLGVFFMATDYVSSPMSKKGMLIFGFGTGVLTILIRVFTPYPEGVSFAILLMNAFTPLINSYTKPKRFGEKLPA